MATLHDGSAKHTARSNAPYGSDQWKRDNEIEVAERPKVLPLNEREYPYGHPDRKLVSDEVAETGCIGNLGAHGKGK